MDAQTASPRARAAWAFSGLDQRDLADRAGLHYDRLRAILAKTNSRDVTLDELQKIADATGVPRAFMENGWTDDTTRRLSALEDQVTQLRGGLVALAAGNLQRTRELLAQLEKGHPGAPPEA